MVGQSHELKGRSHQPHRYSISFLRKDGDKFLFTPHLVETPRIADVLQPCTTEGHYPLDTLNFSKED